MASETTERTFSRLLQYCTSHGLPLPELEYEDGELTMSDGLLEFCASEGISLDWLVCGEVESPQAREFMDALKHFTPRELMRLKNAMRFHLNNDVPLNAALGMFGFKP